MESLSIQQKTLLWLSANQISSVKTSKLLTYFKTTSELWDNFDREKDNLTFLTKEKTNKLSKSKLNFEEKILIRLNKDKAKIVTVFDEIYPEKLRETEGHPYLLYYKGSLDMIESISIAVVGSRKATSYGKWAAEKFTKDLSEIGVNIISGLAVGIDTIAHKTALKYGGVTFGVIGCGINIVYPKKNLELFKDISNSEGAVITEYPFSTQPLPFNFHDRNRIISGLSEGVLVIEAQERSGTLITAGHGANQGREIFAVPGNIDSLYSKGTNALIKDGAKITRSIDDIIEEILFLKEKFQKEKTKKEVPSIDYTTLTDTELKIVKSLESGKNTLEDLSQDTELFTNQLLSNITLLEMKGVIKVEGTKIIIN